MWDVCWQFGWYCIAFVVQFRYIVNPLCTWSQFCTFCTIPLHCKSPLHMITIAATLSFWLSLHRAMHLHGLETPTGWHHNLMNDATCNTLHPVEFSAGHPCIVGNQIYRTRQQQTHVRCIVHCICSCVAPGKGHLSADQKMYKLMWLQLNCEILKHKCCCVKMLAGDLHSCVCAIDRTRAAINENILILINFLTLINIKYELQRSSLCTLC